MFTGLIEATAKVVAHHNNSTDASNRLILEAVIDAPKTGESIAINGVCLTLLPSSDGCLHFDVSRETLQVTTLSKLDIGDRVNLERSMQAGSRFGGHYVTGHVETTATLAASTWVGDCLEIRIDGFLKRDLPYLIPKGSITLDGVSLTINTVIEKSIVLMLVPHTLAQTNLGEKAIAARYNVEFDYLARIVAHQLAESGQLKQEVLL